MRRLRVLGALVSAIIWSRQPLDVGDRGEEQLGGLLGPGEAAEVGEAEDIAAVGALGMGAGPAGDPAFEQLGDAAIEAFGAGTDLRGVVGRPGPAAVRRGR